MCVSLSQSKKEGMKLRKKQITKLLYPTEQPNFVPSHRTPKREWSCKVKEFSFSPRSRVEREKQMKFCPFYFLCSRVYTSMHDQ